MKLAGWFTVFCAGMVLGAGWGDTPETFPAPGEPSGIHGKVVDAATGAPLAGFPVTLYLDPQESGPIRSATVRKTAADGSYRFADLPPDAGEGYAMDVCDDAYFCNFASAIRVAPGESKRVDFAMERFKLLTVRIVSRDMPAQAIAAARVTVFPEDMDTSQMDLRTHLKEGDSMGQAHFVLYRREAYILTVGKPGYKARSLAIALTRNAWEETLTVALEPNQANPTRELAGTVADWSGNADGIAVQFLGRQEDGTRFLFFDNVKAGSFRISGIPMDVAGGFLRVPGAALAIGKEEFASALKLNSRGPLPTGIRAAAREARGKRARSVSRWGTWEGKGRSFDIQGREQSFRLEPSAMPRIFPSR